MQYKRQMGIYSFDKEQICDLIKLQTGLNGLNTGDMEILYKAFIQTRAPLEAPGAFSDLTCPATIGAAWPKQASEP